MKKLLLVPLAFQLMGCTQPVHDNPNSTNQLSQTHVWSGLKDSHFKNKSSPFVDGLMRNYLNQGSGSTSPLVPWKSKGCGVGITINGDTKYVQVYGNSRLESNGSWTRYDFDTMGPIGSASKTITGMSLAMAEVEDNLLDLDAPAYIYSGGDSALEDASTYDMITMQAGLQRTPDWTNLDQIPAWFQNSICPDEYPTADNVDWCLSHPRVALEQFGELSLNEPAGTYSNASASAAAGVLDTVLTTDSSVPSDLAGYEPYTWNKVGHWSGSHFELGELTSLGLLHSWRTNSLDTLSDGFNCNGNCSSVGQGDQLSPWGTAGSHEGWWGPAGGWAMTIGDFTRFVGLLSRPEFEAVVDRMFEFSNFVTGSLYGLGVFNTANNANHPDRTAYWHGGDLDGHTALWYLDHNNGVGDEIGVAMQCNSGGSFYSANLRPYARAMVAEIRANGLPLNSRNSFGDIPSVFYKKYQIDDSSVDLRYPGGMHLPLVSKTEGLFIGLYNRSSTNDNVYLFDGNRYLQNLGTTNLRSNGRSYTAAKDIVVPTVFGDLSIENARFGIGLSDYAVKMVNSRLFGYLDTRTINGSHRNEICELAAEHNNPCRACDDNVKACVYVNYEFDANQ